MFRFSNKKALGQELKCRIRLLVPDEELEVSFNINSVGQDILNDVVAKLDLLDKDYYGLKLHDQVQWLDLTKSVTKQTKGMESVVFELRFKYYPAEPALLANESTRYYLYLQLRLDLIEGRLKSDSQDTIAFLIACILQSELGDYTPNNNENYVADFKFVPNQTEDLEWNAIRLHKNEDFQGLGPADSELNFLKKACQLDTYGIDPYPVKEGNSHNHFLIGVNHRGISTFQDSKKTNQFTWDEIERITLDNKLVLIYCRKVDKKGTKTSKSRALFGFRCPSQEYAHNFWKIATEHRFFFTLDSTPDLPIVTNTGGLFKKNHKLKYIGRVEKDLLRDHVDENRSSGVRRSHSLITKSNDGPRWHGFQQGNNLQSSLNNIYSSDTLNKTMPSNMNYFREEEEDEEDEDQVEDCNSMPYQQQQQQQHHHHQQLANNSKPVSVFDSKKRNSSGSLAKDSPRTFTRRSILTTKSDAAASSANAVGRRDSSIYMDTEHKSNDLMKTTILLALIILSLLLVILLINDADRPNTVTLLVKRLHLEPVSLVLRQNYYLPLKSAIRDTLAQLSSILLDPKLF